MATHRLTTNHLDFIDISKGITIILMVVGHSGIPQGMSHWIWSFHMPFFFFISGMATRWNSASCDFIKRKTRSLLWPFIIYSVVNLIAIPFYSDLTFGEGCMKVLTHGWQGIALWFIPVFYFSLLIVKAIPSRLLLPTTLVLFALGSVLSHFNVQLPWTLASIPAAAGYTCIGRIMSIHHKKGKAFISLSSLWCWVMVITGFAIGYLGSQYWHLDLAFNRVNPIVITTILALIGMAAMICVSRQLACLEFVRKFLGAIGRNTLEIMALSQCIILIINHQFQLSAAFKYPIMIGVIWLAVELRRFIPSLLPQNVLTGGR